MWPTHDWDCERSVKAQLGYKTENWLVDIKDENQQFARKQ